VFGRRRRLPAELHPALERAERVVGWARVGAGGAAVATNLGLFLSGRGPGYERRLGWHEIHKATWDGRQLTIVPAEVVERREGQQLRSGSQASPYVVTADAVPLDVALPEPGQLPQVVRTRVTRSVSFTSHHPVPGGGVRVVARRVPAVDGVTWSVRYDEGTDRANPAVVAATDQLVAAHAAAQQAP
jgi:hypothetical protein